MGFLNRSWDDTLKVLFFDAYIWFNVIKHDSFVCTKTLLSHLINKLVDIIQPSKKFACDLIASILKAFLKWCDRYLYDWLFYLCFKLIWARCVLRQPGTSPSQLWFIGDIGLLGSFQLFAAHLFNISYKSSFQGCNWIKCFNHTVVANRLLLLFVNIQHVCFNE